MRIGREHAAVILGAWLQGEHLEDNKLIPYQSFPEPYDAVAKDLQNGAKLDAIVKRHGAKFIVEINQSYSPVLYQTSVGSYLTERMHETIPPHASPSEVKAHADKYARYWTDAPEPVPLAENYLKAYDERSKTEPAQTGINALDGITNGIYPGQLTVVGARPSTGKSAFCLQVALHVARQGKKVLFLPLEMTAAETIDRVIMRVAHFDYKDLIRGRLERDQYAELAKVLDWVEDMSDRFKVYENVRELEAIEELIRRERPDLIVIDQLSQIRTAQQFGTTRERYTDITRRLKAIALEENTAVWLPCQMNRESSKTGTVTIDYLKESGSIEEDADVVIILANDKNDDGRTFGDKASRVVTMQVAKNRQGATRDGIELNFYAPRFTFTSIQSGLRETTGYEEDF